LVTEWSHGWRTDVRKPFRLGSTQPFSRV
jgi:hypothetical protein